ncbi:RNA polymerase sigma-70 factor (ECF subfamily) [Pseudonocardia endophytica]|uniref:RNA polymerase sigma factor n=2 Tax=Pseudonocardia endophytica TaxID=401976 RepID=A0A4R1HKT9_PSEEN|nr:RNA polymerase sigma-70 factor (ECF subfamily) [Pseudonocardia endophytica]
MRPQRLLRQHVRPDVRTDTGEHRPVGPDRTDTVRPQPDGEAPMPSASSPTPTMAHTEAVAEGQGPPGSAQSMPLPRQRPRDVAQADPRTAAVDTPQEQEPPDPSTEEGSSWALVEACQAGDARAFGELYERYHDVVYRYVLFRMGDRAFAEDVTQETFVRALRRISSVSYQGRDIGAWFVTIARNLIFDYVKSSRYRLESTTSEIVELSPATGGPEQQVLENATNSELVASIDKLNPDQRECIQLRFLKGLSVAETAEIMDRNEGAVKALQHRAVRRLAQLLPDGLR